MYLCSVQNILILAIVCRFRKRLLLLWKLQYGESESSWLGWWNSFLDFFLSMVWIFCDVAVQQKKQTILAQTTYIDFFSGFWCVCFCAHLPILTTFALFGFLTGSLTQHSLHIDGSLSSPIFFFFFLHGLMIWFLIFNISICCSVRTLNWMNWIADNGYLIVKGTRK